MYIWPDKARICGQEQEKALMQPQKLWKKAGEEKGRMLLCKAHKVSQQETPKYLNAAPSLSTRKPRWSAKPRAPGGARKTSSSCSGDKAGACMVWLGRYGQSSDICMVQCTLGLKEGDLLESIEVVQCKRTPVKDERGLHSSPSCDEEEICLQSTAYQIDKKASVFDQERRAAAAG